LRHDLALPYYYETMEWFDLEGEWIPVPVVRVVYRRDRDLRKSEIEAYLINGTIPARYPPRLSGDAVNEPMNEDSWKRLVRRFFLRDVFNSRMPYSLCERSTGFPVQSHYLHFEESLWMRVAVCDRDYNALTEGGPAQLIAEVNNRTGGVWFLDIKRRAALACLRMLVGPDFYYRFPYPGTRDEGEELHDRFDFDDGDDGEEVVIDF
jgi:hypothetical protein